jgi:hypothetical protein
MNATTLNTGKCVRCTKFELIQQVTEEYFKIQLIDLNSISGLVSLRAINPGFFSITAKDAKDESLIAKDFRDVLACTKIIPDSPYYMDCQQAIFDKLELSKDGCLLNGLKAYVKSGEKFNLHIESNQRWHQNIQRDLNEMIDKTPREIMDIWMSFFRVEQNHFWFGDFSRQPMDMEDPRLRIYVPDLVERTGFETGLVTISTFCKSDFYLNSFLSCSDIYQKADVVITFR